MNVTFEICLCVYHFYPSFSYFINVSQCVARCYLVMGKSYITKIQQQDIAYSQLKNTIMVDLAGLLEDYLARGNS